MRWLVGIALAGVTGIGVAAAQTEATSDPSVKVDLTAIPSAERPPVYTGERVVFPLIYPDGSMAVTPKTATTQPAEPVKLTPPDATSLESASTAPETEPDSAAAATQPDEAETPPEVEEEQTAMVVPQPPTTSSTGNSRIPTPSLKPKSISQGESASSETATAEAAPEGSSTTNLFTQPPTAEEQREAKPDAQLAAISPELATAPVSQTPQILFVAGRTELDGAGMAVLDVLALQLIKSKERVELQAFASSAPGQSDSAKKLSLRRALNVRTYLIGKGIDGDRIIIKAKGDATEGTPERVDIVRSAG